jgi:signal peptidase I
MRDKSFEDIIYIGPSMNPTFRDGDLLRLTPCPVERIRCGDVIVFLSPQECQKITHRIISICQDSIHTQGDNNSKVDREILKLEDILGRVDYVKRGERMYRVLGGARGLMYVFFLYLLRPVRYWAFAFLHYPYQFLVNLNMLSRIPYFRSKIRIVSFKRASGEEWQLLFGSRIIGRLLPGKNEWQIKRPFRLFLDRNLLSRE